MTQNPVESMNSALKPFIDLDIVNLIIAANNYIMKIFSFRRSITFTSKIVTPIMKILDRNMQPTRSSSVQNSNANIYLVDHTFTVNLNSINCNCGIKTTLGMPCKHICAVIYSKNLEPSSFIIKPYHSEVYYNNYAENILPLSALNLLRSDVLPPNDRRSRGRPKTKRIHAAHEN